MRTTVSALTGDGTGRRIAPPQIAFGPFQLDPANAMLMRDGRPVRLRPKAFALLTHLVASAGRLLTTKDLLDELWPDVFVGDAALKTCMREIREALGDDARRPAYIETAHRRGYRFIAPVDGVDAVCAADAVFKPPPTQYARQGDVNIAYQVVGDGPIDLVFATGWVSHVEYMWAEPSFACFLKRLASFSRLILFDTRGAGLSDQLPDLPTPEQRVHEVRAVMDAVGSRQAALVGVSDGGPICSLFAAAYPERTLALVMFGSYATAACTPDYPWGQSREQRQRVLERIRRDWGGPVGIDECAPSRAADPRFRTWWSTYLRNGATPAAALALARMNADLDVRDVLPAIRVPTLILHRRGDRAMSVEGAHYIADRIASARLVELPGDDHLPFVGDHDAVVDEIERFLAAPRPRHEVGEVLATA